MKKSNSSTWLIVAAAAIIAIAGIYYWRKSGSKCATICTIDDSGSETCSVVCPAGATAQDIAAAEAAAPAA